MLIKEVLILNLARRPDRRCAMIGHLITYIVDVPQQRIRFFAANDGQAYDSVEAVIDAAEIDGFPQYRQIVANEPQFGAPSRIATDWSWCQAMRYIASFESDERPVLFLYDDMRLHYNFYMLEHVVNFLMKRPGPFHGLQLHCYSWPWDPEPENYWLDGFIQEGFGGRGDYGLILTPEGAQKLLDFHFEEPFDTVNTDLAILSKPPQRQTGFYSIRQNLVDTSTWDFENDREPAHEKFVYDWTDWFNTDAER